MAGIVKNVGYANFKIQIGDIELIHKIYVADIRAGNQLGWNFVRQQGCKIDSNKNVLQVKHVDLPLLECESPLQCYRVILARTIELAPESEMVISGRILGRPEEAETWCVEGEAKFMQDRDVLIARSLVDPRQRSQSFLSEF